MRLANYASIFTAVVLSSVVAQPAAAYDLTGHWVGKWTCAGFDGSKFKDSSKDSAPNGTSTLNVTQSGATIHALIDGTFTYNGAAIADDTKPEKGEGVLIDCHTNTTLGVDDGNSEIIQIVVTTKTSSPKASLKGTSTLENFLAQFGQQIQSCKYSYKRIDTIDPAVGGCVP